MELETIKHRAVVGISNMPRRGEPRLNKDSYIKAKLTQNEETAYLKRKRERDLKKKFFKTLLS